MQVQAIVFCSFMHAVRVAFSSFWSAVQKHGKHVDIRHIQFATSNGCNCVSAGQWVAWKRPGDKAAAGGDLFVKDAFYNLLCPQRPAGV